MKESPSPQADRGYCSGVDRAVNDEHRRADRIGYRNNFFSTARQRLKQPELLSHAPSSRGDPSHLTGSIRVTCNISVVHGFALFFYGWQRGWRRRWTGATTEYRNAYGERQRRKSTFSKTVHRL